MDHINTTVEKIGMIQLASVQQVYGFHHALFFFLSLTFSVVHICAMQLSVSNLNRV